jgi:hypothetical protein
MAICSPKQRKLLAIGKELGGSGFTLLEPYQAPKIVVDERGR